MRAVVKKVVCLHKFHSFKLHVFNLIAYNVINCYEPSVLRVIILTTIAQQQRGIISECRHSVLVAGTCHWQHCQILLSAD